MLFLLLNLWILIDVHQISNDTSSWILLLDQLLLRRLQFFPTCVHFITCCHVVIEVLVYDLVFLLNLLSLIALASCIIIQTFLNHSDATSVIGLFVNLRSISIVSITRGQELCIWLLDITGSAILSLPTSNQQLTLLSWCSTMLVNNIDLAILSLSNVLTRIHYGLIVALFFFELSLLGGETLA